MKQKNASSSWSLSLALWPPAPAHFFQSCHIGPKRRKLTVEGLVLRARLT